MFVEIGKLSCSLKSKIYLELAMLREFSLLRAKISKKAYLKLCFNPNLFAVFCFHRGLMFCQVGSWLLIRHWRNLGRNFYFLFGIWSVCVCSKGFRLEEPIEPTASPRVEAVRDSIQGHCIYSCARPKHRLFFSAEPYPWMWIQSRTTKLCGARCEFDTLVCACNFVFMLLA